MKPTPPSPAARALCALLGATPLMLLAGCAGETGPAPGEQSVAPYDDVTTISMLSLGARGEQVSKVQTFLAHHGYFPNAELAERFPTWVPIVNAAPEPGVYDQATADGVRAYQARNGIDPTGMVGPDTRSAMASTRCGNPDSHELDHDSKFALKREFWADRTFTWKVVDPATCVEWNGSTWVNCNVPITRDQLRRSAMDMMHMWGIETDINFQETTGTADITFQFMEFSQRSAAACGWDLACRRRVRTSNERAFIGQANALAVTVGTFESASGKMVSAVINYNQAHAYSADSVTPASNFDLFAVTLHEVGHALGFDHSSLAHLNPVMKPAIGPGPSEPRMLTIDDRIGVGARYDRWATRPGIANDLAIGAGQIWHIGTAPNWDGFRIYGWNSILNEWREASGDGGATKIAVGNDGRPWVLTNNGSLFFHSAADGMSGAWNHVPGACAREIAAGGGAIWFVTCTPDNDGAGGGFKVGRLIAIPTGPETAALAIEDTPGPSHASKIAVDSSGRPYIVNTSGDVWRRSSLDPRVVGWEQLPGIKATEISVGTPSYVFATGASSQAGRLYVWNEQPEVSHMEGTMKVIDIAGRRGWVELARLPSGTPTQIAASVSGTVWATNGSGAIYENAKTLF